MNRGWSKEKQLKYLESWAKTKEKIAIARREQSSWNSGLTKETDDRIEKYSEKISKTLKDKHISSPKKGKSLEEYYGEEKAKEIKKKCAIWTDKKLSEKHKTSIRLALYRPDVNKKLSVWSKDRLPPNLEYARSKSPIQKGEKNLRWNPNYQDSYGYEFTRRLKLEILNRDKYCCKNCLAFEKLVIHHIDEDKSNNKEDNLITLCRTCHMKVHHKTLELPTTVAVLKLGYMLEHLVGLDTQTVV